MTNAFYNDNLSAVPETLIRSAKANAEFAAVETGFDRVQVKTLASLRAPDGETTTDLPVAATRAGKSLAFDASGNPIAVVAATSAEMAAAVAAAASASADAASAAADAATVAGAVSTLNLLQLLNGIR